MVAQAAIHDLPGSPLLQANQIARGSRQFSSLVRRQPEPRAPSPWDAYSEPDPRLTHETAPAIPGGRATAAIVIARADFYVTIHLRSGCNDAPSCRVISQSIQANGLAVSAMPSRAAIASTPREYDG